MNSDYSEFYMVDLWIINFRQVMGNCQYKC